MVCLRGESLTYQRNQMKLFHNIILAAAVAGISFMSVNLAVAKGWIEASSSDVGSGGFLKDLFCRGHVCLVDYNIYYKASGVITVRHEINTSIWQFRAKPKESSVILVKLFSSPLSSSSINQG